MLDPQIIYQSFKNNGIEYFAGVPDSLLKDICAYITTYTPKNQHVIAVNEGTALSLCAGYYLSTGKLALAYMQNSGIGNAINPLLSLLDEKIYKIPILLMIGWRGEPNIKDEPQHIKQGEITLKLLEVLDIPYVVLERDEQKAVSQIDLIVRDAISSSKPHAIIVRKSSFSKFNLSPENSHSNFSREEALKLILELTGETDILISTTGKLSRELYELRKLRKEELRDFITVGSMGHCSSIALGVAMQKQNRRVFCLDGDGSFLMHMGAIGTIGNLAPINFYHLIFNNNSHESVGGQPTISFSLDLLGIAKACGYKHAFKIEDRPQLQEIISDLEKLEGPVLLDIQINKHSRPDLGRPNESPLENKIKFMNFLQKYS